MAYRADIGPEPRNTAPSRCSGPEPFKTDVEPRDTSVEPRMHKDSALNTQTQLLFGLAVVALIPKLILQ